MSATIVATERVPVDQLEPHPDNARQGDVEAIKSSLLIHGQYRTIVANRRDRRVLAGNHTYMAARDLGWEEVEVNWVEADPEQAMKILLVDNRLSDVAHYNNPKLAAQLERMMLAGELEGTGYAADDVDDLLAEIDALPESEGETDADYAESAEDTAARYRPPSEVQPMRQIVLLYPQDQGAEVEANVRVLKDVWGMDSVRDVVAEALRRAIEAGIDTPEAS